MYLWCEVSTLVVHAQQAAVAIQERALADMVVVTEARALPLPRSLSTRQ